MPEESISELGRRCRERHSTTGRLTGPLSRPRKIAHGRQLPPVIKMHSPYCRSSAVVYPVMPDHIVGGRLPELNSFLPRVFELQIAKDRVLYSLGVDVPGSARDGEAEELPRRKIGEAETVRDHGGRRAAGAFSRFRLTACSRSAGQVNETPRDGSRGALCCGFVRA